MNYLKDNPVGIDKHIQKMQISLYDKLGYNNFDGYGRVYLLDEKGVKPHYYLKNGNYKEVLTDNKLNGSFYFVEKPNSTLGTTELTTEVDIIFQLDLKKIKPNITHRADEEVRAEIFKIIKKIKYFKLSQITKGIEALSDFNTDLADEQPYLYLRFRGNMRYNINC